MIHSNCFLGLIQLSLLPFIGALFSIRASAQSTPPPACSPESREKGFSVQLDWRTGETSISRITKAGTYCLEAVGVNYILYDYQIKGSIQSQGSPVTELARASAALPTLFSGGSPDSTTSPGLFGGTADLCATQVKQAAKYLADAIADLQPKKDSTSHYESIPLNETLTKWETVSSLYQKLKESIPGQNTGLDGPCEQQREIVTNAVKSLAVPYQKVNDRVETPPRFYHTEYLSETDYWIGTVSERYNTVSERYNKDTELTTAPAQTYELKPSFTIFTTSIGFMLTTLQARSYTSRTAPDAAGSGTLNVLGVDYGSGVRPSLTALLNFNLPTIGHLRLASDKWGLALSTGPVFDLTNGKADTSRFGFFGGLSLQLWNRLYLTPGIHLGEFADFPTGFQAGQVIPSGVGTPIPVKRYTARFAIGVTYGFSTSLFKKAPPSADASATDAKK